MLLYKVVLHDSHFHQCSQKLIFVNCIIVVVVVVVVVIIRGQLKLGDFGLARLCQDERLVNGVTLFFLVMRTSTERLDLKE